MPLITPTWKLTYQREPYPDEPFYWHKITIDIHSMAFVTADRIARKLLDTKLQESNPKIPVLYSNGLWHLKEALVCDNRKNPTTKQVDLILAWLVGE